MVQLDDSHIATKICGRPPHDWQLYTDALMHAYSCQRYTSKSIAALDLVLSKQPRPIELKHMPSWEDPKGDFKNNWNNWLLDMVKEANGRLKKAQEKLKRNYDAKHEEKQNVIHLDDYVFLQSEWNNLTDDRQKLTPVI